VVIAGLPALQELMQNLYARMEVARENALKGGVIWMMMVHARLTVCQIRRVKFAMGQMMIAME
jgi:hypothetical protein